MTEQTVRVIQGEDCQPVLTSEHGFFDCPYCGERLAIAGQHITTVECRPQDGMHLQKVRGRLCKKFSLTREQRRAALAAYVEPPPAPEYITVQEAAETLNVSKERVRQLIHSHQLAAHKATRKPWTVSVESIEQRIADRAAALEATEARRQAKRAESKERQRIEAEREQARAVQAAKTRQAQSKREQARAAASTARRQLCPAGSRTDN